MENQPQPSGEASTLGDPDVLEANFFRTLVDNSSVGVIFLDEKGAVRYCNPSAKHILGYSPEDCRGRKALEYLHPEDSILAEEAIRDLLQERVRDFEGKFRIRHRDGTWRWIQVEAHGLPSASDIHGIAVHFHDISALQEAERRMRESEASFRLIMDVVKDYGIVMLDNQGCITSWSRGAERILGYPESEVLGRQGALIFVPDDVTRGEPERELKTAEVEGRAEDERWHMRKDGSRFYASGVLTAIRDAEGNLKGFCKIMNDATERKLAEEALQQSRENYVSLVDSIDGIIWEAEGERRTHTFISKKAETMLGYPLENWYTDPHFWEKLIADEDRQRVLEVWDKAFKEKRGYILEYRLIDSQGCKKWFRDYVTAVTPPGSPTKLRAVMVDISPQKAAQKRQEMQFQVTGILASSSSLEKAAPDILANLGEGLEWDLAALWTRDPEQETWHVDSVWNPDPGKHPGYPWDTRLSPDDGEPARRALESRSPIWIPDLAEAARKQGLSARLRTALQAGIRSAFLFPILRDGGEFGVVELWAGSVKAQDQEVMEATRSISLQIGLFIERVETEKALQISQEQFRQSQKMEAIGRLAGGVAHDFNNLLTAINGYSELLLSRVEEGSPVRPQLEEIHKAGQRAASLTKQLLAYSRKQVLEPKIISLNHIVADMGKMIQRIIGEDIRLKLELAPDLGLVKIDPGQMEQVLLNLAVNARDAMPSGGELRLETSNVRIREGIADAHLNIPPGHYASLSVADTGRGMDEKIISRLFEPFFTTKEAGKGTGLGLSMVYGIIQQSGGHISVRSEPGKGTTFALYLPLIREEDPMETTLEITPGEGIRGEGTILLVEDEEGVLKLVEEILVQKGYAVLLAHNGKEALKREEEHPEPIDLLLTDFIMEGMNGREIYEVIHRRRPDLKVLYMSGYTNDAILRRGLGTASPAFLQKPFSPNALMDKVFKLMRGVEPTRRNRKDT